MHPQPRAFFEVDPGSLHLLLELVVEEYLARALVAVALAGVAVQLHPGPRRPHGVARENLVGLLLALLLLLAVGPQGGQQHHLGVRVHARRAHDQNRQT